MVVQRACLGARRAGREGKLETEKEGESTMLMSRIDCAIRLESTL
jgi:hypothetical protein